MRKRAHRSIHLNTITVTAKFKQVEADVLAHDRDATLEKDTTYQRNVTQLVGSGKSGWQFRQLRQALQMRALSRAGFNLNLSRQMVAAQA